MHSPTTELDTQPISGWRALVSVLTSPGETFRRLGARPPILPVYLFQTLLMALLFILTFKAGAAAFDQGIAAAGSQPNAQAMDASGLAVVRTVTMTVMGVFTIAGPWLVGLVLSLFALFMGQFQGGGVSYGSYFGMIGYARMPLAIASILGGIYQVATGKALNLSLAAFLSPESNPYLTGLLSTINPFTIWYYVLLAMGFATLFGRPARRGWALPALIWVINVLFTVVFSGVGSRFTQFQ